MMEGDVRKKGMLYQQQQRFGKKWKKIWAEAVADSTQSVSRLEIYEFSKSSMKDSKKRAEGKKVIVMRDCIKIREKEDEGCPKECKTFLLETADKTHMFASPTLEVYSWVSELCKLAFPLNQTECRSQKQEHQPVDMQENTLYATTESVQDFQVVTVATEAAVRCKLYGDYILTPKHDSLLLKDSKTKQVLFAWPYRYVRKFGQDMLTFNFEAGRRCDSGEGYFEFATSQSEQLFTIIGDSLKKLPKADAPGTKLKDEESAPNPQKALTPPTQVKHPKKKLTASSSLSSISVSNNPGKDSKGKNINSIPPPPSDDVQDPVYALVFKPKSHPKNSKDKNQQLGPLPDFVIVTEEEEEDVPLPPPIHTSFKKYEAETVYSEVKSFNNYGRRNEAFDSTGDVFYEHHSPNLTVCPDNMDHHSGSPSKFNLSNDISYIPDEEEQLGTSMERLAIHCAPDAYGAESMYSQEVDYYDGYRGNEEFEDNVDQEYFYPPCDPHFETGLSNTEGSQAQGFSTYDNLPKRL